MNQPLNDILFFPQGKPPPIKCEQCVSAPGLDFEFEYAFQPIVDLEAGTIFAHEALVRGPAEEPAGEILAQVNDSNRYRFDQTCRVRAVKGASALGMSEYLSINFLPNAVYRPELCIRTTLEAASVYNFPTERIIFEVTEGEKITDRAHLANIIAKYKEFGFLTAIDDFGAGYAGLNLLADYQPDLIKLDMDLTRGIEVDKMRQSIIKAILGVCADFNIRVIAEGVETAGERDFLFDAGVRLMQGYLFCKPVFRGLGTINAAAWRHTSAP